MTIQEISNEFDILYNNIASGAAPPLNAYEKSVLLTKAQQELVVNYYNGANTRSSSFEATEEVRRYLDTLIRTVTFTTAAQEGVEMSFYKYTYNKPSDLLFIVREYAKTSGNGCFSNFQLMINPIAQEDLNRVLNDPFKGPTDRKAIRVDTATISNVQFEVYSKRPLGEYNIVYLKTPAPIILDDLTIWGVSIDGEVSPTIQLDVPELLQRNIINRAVELAKVAYIGDLNATLAVNQRSQ